MPISKVVFGNDTLIDISNSDVSATSVESGRLFYDATGTSHLGIGSVLGHQTELLSNGGTAHYINGVDLADDDLRASTLMSGYTAHDRNGNEIVGTYSVGTAVDVSDTTAVASDVASGKYFYAADGTYTNGSLIIPTMKMGVIRSDAELVKTWSHDAYWAANDSGTIPSYTTTATTIHTGAAITPTQALDVENYRYFVLFRCVTIPIYNTDTKSAGRFDYSITSGRYEIVEIPGNVFTNLNGTKYTSRNTTVYASGLYYRSAYWTSASKWSMYTATSYGIHQTGTAPTLSSATSATPTLTIKDPNLIIKGSSTYLSSTNWGKMTDIRRQYVIELYRVSKATDDLGGWGIYSQYLHIQDCIESTNHKLT